MRLPSRLNTRSPGCSPALAPGLPSSTSATITPASAGRFSASASVEVIVCAVTPISPRRTRPVLRICSNDVADDVARRREADAFAAARLRVDEGVDADQPALGIDQRAAAVARIDGRVGLDVDHRVFRRQLARDGADDAERDRRVEAERAAEREHQLARPQRVGVAEGERRQRLGLDLDHRQIGLVIDRDDLRADRAAAPAEDGASGLAARRRKRQLDLDARRVLDHVRVGHDVAVGIDDDAGAAAPLEHRLRARVGIVLVWRREAGDEDLHDAGADFLGEILERPGQVAKRGGLRRGALGVCGGGRQEKASSARTR